MAAAETAETAAVAAERGLLSALDEFQDFPPRHRCQLSLIGPRFRVSVQIDFDASVGTFRQLVWD